MFYILTMSGKGRDTYAYSVRVTVKPTKEAAEDFVVNNTNLAQKYWVVSQIVYDGTQFDTHYTSLAED